MIETLAKIPILIYSLKPTFIHVDLFELTGQSVNIKALLFTVFTGEQNNLHK